MDFISVLEKSKLIAILRGVEPHEVLDVANILVKSGFKILEVPLNSPSAFDSIKKLQEKYKDDKEIIIGAGTVCSADDVKRLHKIEAQIVISPNTNKQVIKKTKKLNMISVPGFLTPSEAYDAIEEGADALKLFPLDTFGYPYYKSIKTILPKDFPIIAVGGIDESNIKEYIQEGISYFGLGSALYKPNMDLDLLKAKAEYFMNAIKED